MLREGRGTIFLGWNYPMGNYPGSNYPGQMSGEQSSRGELMSPQGIYIKVTTKSSWLQVKNCEITNKCFSSYLVNATILLHLFKVSFT